MSQKIFDFEGVPSKSFSNYYEAQRTCPVCKSVHVMTTNDGNLHGACACGAVWHTVTVDGKFKTILGRIVTHTTGYVEN